MERGIPTRALARAQDGDGQDGHWNGATFGAAFVFDTHGRISFGTRAAWRLVGIMSDQVPDELPADLLSDDDRAAFDNALVAARSGRGTSTVLRLRQPAGDASKTDQPQAKPRETEFRCEPMPGSADGVVYVTLADPDEDMDNGDDVSTDDSAVLSKGLRLLGEASRRLGSTLDLDATAWEFVDMVVPAFADGAGVYVLEHLLSEDELPHRSQGAGIEVRRIASALVDQESVARNLDSQPDGVITLPADTPYAECVAYGRPVVIDTLRAAALDALFPDTEDWSELVETLGKVSALVLPLTARSVSLGFVWLYRGPQRAPYTRQDVAIALELAARAGVSVDNARLYDRERRVAAALQRSLQPGITEVPPGLSVAHRYLPCRNAAVGGDWYDVVELPGGRAALVVGDVMGHGMRAAAVMGQLRTAMRAFASLDLPPAEILERLDAMAQRIDAQFATCVYVVCDPVDGSCLIVRAGHVPPVLAGPDGSAEVLELPAGLPLGLGAGGYETRRVRMAPGSTLMLCTDGLVESRQHDIDVGIGALRAALTYSFETLEETCDALLELIPKHTDGDDVTLLLARTEPTALQGAAAGRRWSDEETGR